MYLYNTLSPLFYETRQKLSKAGELMHLKKFSIYFFEYTVYNMLIIKI
jgi:hypothetical protein